MDDNQLWDSVAEEYEDHSYHGVRGCYPANKFRAEIVVDFLSNHKGRLLDAGCGPAYVGRQAVKMGYEVCCIDFSEKMLEYAENKMCEEGLSANFQHCSVCDMSVFEDQSFDVVMMLGVLPYINADDEIKAYSEVNRLLKQGGHFIAAQYNKKFMDSLKDKGRVKRFKKAFTEAGINVKDSRAYAQRFAEEDNEEYTMKFEDPEKYAEKLAAHGLKQLELHYYNFHVAPPSDFREEDTPTREKLERMFHDKKLGTQLAKTFLSISQKK